MNKNTYFQYLLDQQNLYQLNNLKIGEVVYAKTDIHQQTNDHSPGGRLCMWADVLILDKVSVNVIPHDETMSSLIYYYHVRHPNMVLGNTFFAYRHEIMPTDPLLTNDDKLRWKSISGRKDPMDRF